MAGSLADWPRGSRDSTHAPGDRVKPDRGNAETSAPLVHDSSHDTRVDDRVAVSTGLTTTPKTPRKTPSSETGGAQDGARIADSALGGSVSPPIDRLALLARLEGLAATREAVLPIIRMYVTLNPADREALANALASLPVEDLTRLAIPREAREEV
jgi:hypothetical protein